MFHMVVNTHTSDTCAFRSEENEKVLRPAIQALGKAATAKGGKLTGWWINTTSHTFFFLIDAPDAHAVNGMLEESGLVGLTHSVIYPVEQAEAVLERTG
jgi:hypothetical protein